MARTPFCRFLEDAQLSLVVAVPESQQVHGPHHDSKSIPSPARKRKISGPPPVAQTASLQLTPAPKATGAFRYGVLSCGTSNLLIQILERDS